MKAKFVNESYRYRGDWKLMMSELKYYGWEIGKKNINIPDENINLLKGTYVIKYGMDEEDNPITDYLYKGDSDNIEIICKTKYDSNTKYERGSFDAEGMGAGEINSDYYSYRE